MWKFRNPPHDQQTISDDKVKREIKLLEMELQIVQTKKKDADAKSKREQENKLDKIKRDRQGRRTARSGPDTVHKMS